MLLLLLAKQIAGCCWDLHVNCQRLRRLHTKTTKRPESICSSLSIAQRTYISYIQPVYQCVCACVCVGGLGVNVSLLCAAFVVGDCDFTTFFRHAHISFQFPHLPFSPSFFFVRWQPCLIRHSNMACILFAGIDVDSDHDLPHFHTSSAASASASAPAPATATAPTPAPNELGASFQPGQRTFCFGI